MMTVARIQPETIREMADMRERGLSLSVIARILSAKGTAVSSIAVEYHCLKLGVIPPAAARRRFPVREGAYWRGGVLVRPYTPAEDAIILAGREAGLSSRRIARQLDNRKQHSVLMRLMTLARREAFEEASKEICEADIPY